MKAALMYGPSDIRVEEIARPECPEGGFILKVVAIGLCGSDIRNLTTDSRKGDYPHIYGHEITGIVDEVSDSCTKYKVGDRLYIYPVDHCMECEACRTGHSEMCENGGDYTNRQGGFADYVPVTKTQVERDSIYRIPDGVSFERASLGEPFSSVYACQENIEVGFGDTIVIIGAGPIGCMAAAIVKFSGARHVVVTDMNPYRLELAKKLGATRTVNLKEEKLTDVMKEIGMTEGFDVGLEMSGSQIALDDMIHNMKHGGHIALLGLQRTDATVDLETVIFNGLNIRGIYGRKVWDTWYKMSTMLQAGLDISEIITHRFDIKDYEKGFEAMISGQSGKVVLDWAHVND